MLNWPVAEPTVDGLNVRVTVTACPGFSVFGRLSAEAEKPLPVTANEFTVTGAVPLEVSVIVCVVELFTTTAPNAILDAFTLSVEVAAFSCSDTVLEVVPADAVRVADWAVETEATFAVKVALVAVAGTETVPGTVTALLLLASPTLTPPLGAEPDKLTVHESAMDPVIVAVMQLMALMVGVTVVPVPLRLIADVGALLDTVNCPVTELATVGSN